MHTAPLHNAATGTTTAPFLHYQALRQRGATPENARHLVAREYKKKTEYGPARLSPAARMVLVAGLTIALAWGLTLAVAHVL